MPSGAEARGDAYAQSSQDLLPPGKLWVRLGATLRGLLRAAAQALGDADRRSSELLDSRPDSPGELLVDWERFAGLPEKCGELPDSYSARVQDLLQKLTTVGGASPDYFIGLAAQLGVTITIREYSTARIGTMEMGDTLGDQFAFVWTAVGDGLGITEFKMGQGVMGDPLRWWNQQRIQCLFGERKPAHTYVTFEDT